MARVIFSSIAKMTLVTFFLFPRPKAALTAKGDAWEAARGSDSAEPGTRPSPPVRRPPARRPGPPRGREGGGRHLGLAAPLRCRRQNRRAQRRCAAGSHLRSLRRSGRSRPSRPRTEVPAGAPILCELRARIPHQKIVIHDDERLADHVVEERHHMHQP